MRQGPDPDSAQHITASSSGGVDRAGAWWTWRAVLLGPAIIQLVVAYSLYRELREGVAAPAILVPVALLHVAGAAGILGGVLGRSRTGFFLGLACVILGFALPIAMNAVAAPVDKDTSSIQGLGTFDAEVLGTLMFLGMLFEAPFWLLYAAIAAWGYLRLRFARGRSAPQMVL